MLEPASPEEGFIMMRGAFDLSEQFKVPIIIRETRAFSQASDTFNIPSFDYNPTSYEVIKEPFRFVPLPSNVVQKHQELHRQMFAFKDWTETCKFNQSNINSKKGIIASGFAYRKLLERWMSPSATAAAYRRFC